MQKNIKSSVLRCNFRGDIAIVKVTSMTKVSSKHTFILPEEKDRKMSNIFPE